MATYLTPHRGKVVYIGTLVFTVATDDDATPILSADEFGAFDAIAIISDGTAQVGTVTLAALKDITLDTELDASYATVQSPPGTDVAVAADKAVVITAMPFPAIRLESSGTEIADQTYYVYGIRGASS
jgi:hypothetical protein